MSARGTGSKWILLSVAIVAEVSASVSLKAGLAQPAWFVVTAIGYVASFAILAALLRRGEPVGVIYGIWAACGVALTAVLGMLLYGEPLEPWTIVGIVIVIVGVLLVETGSSHAPKADPEVRG